jgi:hypothetical protein
MIKDKDPQWDVLTEALFLMDKADIEAQQGGYFNMEWRLDPPRSIAAALLAALHPCPEEGHADNCKCWTLVPIGLPKALDRLVKAADKMLDSPASHPEYGFAAFRAALAAAKEATDAN